MYQQPEPVLLFSFFLRPVFFPGADELVSESWQADKLKTKDSAVRKTIPLFLVRMRFILLVELINCTQTISGTIYRIV